MQSSTRVIICTTRIHGERCVVGNYCNPPPERCHVCLHPICRCMEWIGFAQHGRKRASLRAALSAEETAVKAKKLALYQTAIKAALHHVRAVPILNTLLRCRFRCIHTIVHVRLFWNY